MMDLMVPRTAEVPKGFTFILHCLVEGEVTWKLNGDELPRNVHVWPQLKIILIEQSMNINSGEYTCTSNSFSSYGRGHIKVIGTTEVHSNVYKPPVTLP